MVAALHPIGTHSSIKGVVSPARDERALVRSDTLAQVRVLLLGDQQHGLDQSIAGHECAL